MTGKRDRTAVTVVQRGPISPTRIISVLGSVVGLFIMGWVGWIHTSLYAQGVQIAAESKERTAGQSDGKVTATEIKGKVENLEKDVKRVEQKVDEGLKEITTQQRQNLEKVLDAIERRGKTR